MINLLEASEWATAAALGLGAALLALKVFKIHPLWAVIIGMVVFTGLWFPIQTHAVLLDVPRPSH